MTACRFCRAAVPTLLDVGPQPITNRFPERLEDPEESFPLSFGVCERCGTAQLLSLPPAEALRPRVDWITYLEPEPHLDGLADRLMSLPGIGPQSTVCGISVKDDSLLQRLAVRGVRQVWRPDPARELAIEGIGAGVETLQTRLTPEAGRRLRQQHGTSDIVVARHILEHAQDPRVFLEGLRALVAPAGYVVLEVPDCQRALGARDYTMLWEEHPLYFTPATFGQASAQVGHVEQLLTFPYPLENSLVAIIRLGTQELGALPQDTLRREAERAQAYATAFVGVRDGVQAALAAAARRGGTVLFGAGHLGAVFLNVMGVGPFLRCVIDDHPHKRGRFMPGSRLPIRGSEALAEEAIRLCLLAVNPEREAALMARYGAFLARGGTFASLFPGSRCPFEPLTALAQELPA